MFQEVERREGGGYRGMENYRNRSKLFEKVEWGRGMGGRGASKIIEID